MYDEYSIADLKKTINCMGYNIDQRKLVGGVSPGHLRFYRMINSVPFLNHLSSMAQLNSAKLEKYIDGR